MVVERRREGDEDTAPTYRIWIDAEEGGFPIKDTVCAFPCAVLQ